MQLIYSKGKPISADRSFTDAFCDLMAESDHLRIASAYVSEDSLLFLRDNISHKKLSCELLIGMHNFDGITRSQYQTASDFGEFLIKKKLGYIAICKAYPFHGKVYNFLKTKEPYAAIVGSSNLSQILPTRQRNVDICFKDAAILNEINAIFEWLMKSSVPIQEWKPREFLLKNNLLKDCIGVRKINDEEYLSVYKTKANITFQLPLKPEQKSNLNICFGKGRENIRSGIIKHRSWYEMEIIVNKKITSQKKYPRDREFFVYTDDGWAFECKTQGDYSKNFRSTGGLAILGMWVKGRLQDAGIAKAGDFITAKMLKKYGKDYIELTATKDPNKWLLNF